MNVHQITDLKCPKVSHIEKNSFGFYFRKVFLCPEVFSINLNIIRSAVQQNQRTDRDI